jgi:hypothetical protein
MDRKLLDEMGSGRYTVPVDVSPRSQGVGYTELYVISASVLI